jgi:hypothetical protein
MKFLNTIAGSALALSLLTACGGGGGGSSVTSYSGSTAQATLSSSNSSAFTKASADATSNELAGGSIPGALKTSNKLMMVQSKTVNSLLQEPVPGVCDSGSVDVSGGQTSGTIRYNNCTVSDINFTVTVSGTATYTTANNFNDFTIQYTNFTVTIADFNSTHTETIENMTISCTSGGMSCSITSDFTGSDGKVYRIADFNVTGTYPNYIISGRLYHPDHGYVDVSGSVSYSTCGAVERPTSGSITFTGANGTATITFVDCNSFSIDVNSSVTTGSW